MLITNRTRSQLQSQRSYIFQVTYYLLGTNQSQRHKLQVKITNLVARHTSQVTYYIYYSQIIIFIDHNRSSVHPHRSFTAPSPLAPSKNIVVTSIPPPSQPPRNIFTPPSYYHHTNLYTTTHHHRIYCTTILAIQTTFNTNFRI